MRESVSTWWKSFLNIILKMNSLISIILYPTFFFLRVNWFSHWEEFLLHKNFVRKMFNIMLAMNQFFYDSLRWYNQYFRYELRYLKIIYFAVFWRFRWSRQKNYKCSFFSHPWTFKKPHWGEKVFRICRITHMYYSNLKIMMIAEKVMIWNH